MKVIFFGLGSIGLRHARLLLSSFDHELYAFRSNATNKNKNELGIQELYSWEEVEKIRPEVAFITGPTSLHLDIAIKCSKFCNKFFIEKPLDASTENVTKFLDIIKKNGAVTYLAYNLRFHPVVVKLKEFSEKNTFLHMRVKSTSFLPNWRPTQNHLESYSAHKKLGGGVILDLSHEFDYINYLLGDIVELRGVGYKKSNVTIDTEDFVDVLIKSSLGQTNLHLDYFSHHTTRTIDIDFREISISANLIKGNIEIYKDGKLQETLEFPYELDKMYQTQLEYFFNNIENNQMMNNVGEASDLFRKIIDFKEGETYE